MLSGAVIVDLTSWQVDLSQKCDPMDYGTPAFYCITLGRTQCLKVPATTSFLRLTLHVGTRNDGIRATEDPMHQVRGNMSLPHPEGEEAP